MESSWGVASTYIINHQSPVLHYPQTAHLVRPNQCHQRSPVRLGLQSREPSDAARPGPSRLDVGAADVAAAALGAAAAREGHEGLP